MGRSYQGSSELNSAHCARQDREQTDSLLQMTKANEEDFKVDLNHRPLLQKVSQIASIIYPFFSDSMKQNRRKSFEPRAFASGKVDAAPQGPRPPALGQKNPNVARMPVDDARHAVHPFKPRGTFPPLLHSRCRSAALKKPVQLVHLLRNAWEL